MYQMKKLIPLLALSLALSFSACTKKEAAPEGEQVEGTTSAASEQAAPSEEMQEKKEEAPAATPEQ
jgi:hypothetical protein